MTVDWTAAQKTNYNNQTGAAYPQATRLRTATKLYNCHSYAWYSQATANNIWINAPAQAKYWTDGSYVGDYNVGHPNSKVRYANDDHSAISQNDSWRTSKWGSMGLYQHGANYSPYNNTGQHYYRAAG